MKTILIVEDDYLSYLLLEEVLNRNNFNIKRAYNGKEAVDIINSKMHFDFVLMDLVMPIMDGYEATRRIKQLRPELPVYAYTACAMPVCIKNAMESGCSGYFTKPIDVNKFIQELKYLK